MSGYVSEEKSGIASRYLGLQAAEADVELESSAVDVLIKYYCRESGVRNLKKHIEKVESRRVLCVLFGMCLAYCCLYRYIARLRLNSCRI